MSPFFSNKKLIVLLVCIILLVALVGYSTSDRKTLTWPEQLVQDSVGTVQSAFSRPAHLVAGFFGNIQDIRNVYEENRILKSQLDDYASTQVELEELRRQNEELQGQLDLEEDLFDYTSRSALVIQRSPDRWNEQIGINKGSQNGIEENQAVMTSKGLIGKVDQVSQFSATVQLLSDTDVTNRISAIVSSDETIQGFIEGIDEETGHLRFSKIDMEADLEDGQTVSTSGLGGVFPAGLEIGEIVDYENDEYGLTKTAFVEPSAEFYHLDHVMIVDRSASALEEEIDPALTGEDDES
ncbi:rod shape-determining protein MreC [Salisediminibacterium halotolerans]|uniref:Cell shape-determining protein MreC n=1 Tax=Salisediminibacterium halotolerans TaxID=517425 RepID=A0A1H9R3D1_9BACI|nr:MULTISPECIES: rod shape-determining protein MreC [Salisediminibacterium]RLJ78221.1 rod shape-determining protein MreC [Actinophytocola xinjiangensis]RPE88440.1 rod shape-determining protein MreC [Salisediminibacterium halotolerans]TWG37198.1 rod shape-determining protein MreC [Salisediminibacterium halotolerans]SER67015.1 rod shape-determining protein MreC [Salisediminibacterium haloalkalitolerans]GEL07132.1 cell shape-determining protein MreC [Salisediminibacterium halotolerans]